MNVEITYRVKSWPAMPGKFNALRFRRALVAMSVGPVSQDRLERHCGLRRREMRSLLAELAKVDILDVGHRTVGDPNPTEASPAFQTTFWARCLKFKNRLGNLCRLEIRPSNDEGPWLNARVVLPSLSAWQSTSSGQSLVPT